MWGHFFARRTISLSTILTLSSALLAALLFANLAFILFPANQRLVKAEHNREAVFRYEAIFEAANAISAERGPSNVMMSIENGQDRRAAGRLREFRHRTDSALERVETTATQIDGPDLGPLRRTLLRGRAEIDRIAELPEEARSLAMRVKAIGTMIAVFDEFQPVIADQKYRLLRSNQALAGSLQMAHEASDLREFAGRLGSYLIPYVASGEPISVEHLRLIDETVGRVLQLVRMLPSEVGDTAGDPLMNAADEIASLYVAEGLQFIRNLTDEGRGADGYSVNGQDLTDLYVPTMSPLTTFRENVIDTMVERFRREADEARALMRWAILAVATITTAILLVFFALHRVTVLPLLSARRRVIDLSNDRLDDPGQDRSLIAETSGLFQALSVLRERLLERREVLQDLRLRSQTDTLTGLMSRSHFESRMKEEARKGLKGTFGVIYIDIDHFKDVNDTLGHQLGDTLLREIGCRFQSLASDSTLVGRIGGDEFAICCSRTPPAGREAIARQILRLIAEIDQADGLPIRVTASIGLSTGEPTQNSHEELCRQADVALYTSKAVGRNTFTWYHPKQALSAAGDGSGFSELRSALDECQFHLLYQPIVDLRTGSVSAREALARWTHPVRGAVAPAVFIPVLEEVGLIGPFGEWALRSALQDAAAWPDEAGVCVNVSPHQLDEPTFPLKVVAALKESGINPSRLCLEITEGTSLHEHAQRRECLTQLNALGLRIAIDDVGTGFAGLSAIQSIKVDVLKLDRCFVDSIESCDRSRAILRNLTGLARDLGSIAIAEGVETASQLEWLRQNGCDYGQGYFLGRPERGDFEVPSPLPAAI